MTRAQERRQARRGGNAPEVGTPTERINHPSYYGGNTTYEAINVIEAWGLGFCLGNAVKYVCRAGSKNANERVMDLEKAAWYLDREIARAKMIQALAEVKR